MELRHLRYFVAVAEELNFSRAAERLHVSQPPLSQQIKQLEEEVEVRLFDRCKRWVRLTSGGRLFLEHARQVLAQVDSAVLAARRTMGGEGDRLSVACTPWADLMAVPPILRCFSEVHPQIQIEIQTLNSVLQLRAVKARAVDVGFMLSPPGDQGLHMERLVRYPLVVALPSNHRLAARAHLSPRDLAGERYVTLAADVAPVYGEIVTEYWEQAGVAMKERLKVDQPHAVIDLVAAGAGFALVPSSVQEYEKKRIVCRRLDPAPPELELALAWAPGVECLAINSLLEVARQVVGHSRLHVSGESGAESHSDCSGLSGLAPLSRPGATGHDRTIGAHHPGARSSLLRTRQLPRHNGRKSTGTTQVTDVRVTQAS
jgi:DNA-binding transcriptional LysR family regulator